MVRIALDGKFDVTVAQHLAELKDSLEDNGMNVTASSITVPGLKVELVTGLAIASLTVTTISTVINVTNFWRSQRPGSYRVILETTSGTEAIGDRATPAIVDAVEKGQVTGIRIEKA